MILGLKKFTIVTQPTVSSTVKMKVVILIFLTLIAFLYSFKFGYILTANGHGGQLEGVPFAILIMLLTIMFFFAKKQTLKQKLLYTTLILFLALAGFSITVEVIRRTKEDFFQYLYLESGGMVNKLLMFYLILGVILLAWKIKQFNKESLKY
ncbi:hypothetical protein [Adhaeribacter pallidiroseus]|uniref:Uncharacterized protein n=1 Tax=Adhaeribacter pallidiroseus TaxID=2072847 RepID=A0A369QH00_9BACT|nr:hypothetical protein [Adhaeribacter pallidiroseus]RDC64203.1 hypothetical protein AHMF7616_02815 [Adhaeribacter pallidiroseus]